MPNADLLRKLFLSFRRQDDQAFTWAAQQIISEERHKHHNLLADELAQILNGASPALTRRQAQTQRLNNQDDLPKDRESGVSLVELRHPNRSLEDVVLSPGNEGLIQSILREYRRADMLQTHGVKPRRHLLFCGPPGCGKTLTAEVMATELHVPLLYTRFDSMISSYLGETAANLRKLFEFAAQDTWILFFDEFDAIGKSRDDPGEHGELKRVVNSFLQLLDSFPGEGMIVAATNHEALLDAALWRRFDDVILFSKPSPKEINLLVEKKLGSVHHHEFRPPRLASLLGGMSHADIERVCRDSLRQMLMDSESCVSWETFKNAVEAHKRRLAIGADAATASVSRQLHSDGLD